MGFQKGFRSVSGRLKPQNSLKLHVVSSQTPWFNNIQVGFRSVSENFEGISKALQGSFRGFRVVSGGFWAVSGSSRRISGKFLEISEGISTEFQRFQIKFCEYQKFN